MLRYAQATQQGRSDLQLQLKPFFVYTQLLSNSLYGKQQDFGVIFQKTTMVLDNAALITPEHYQIYANRGWLLSKKVIMKTNIPGIRSSLVNKPLSNLNKRYC